MMSVSSLFASPLFLRRVLWLDAATCVATGALQLLLPGVLAGLLGLPESLLLGSGWLLLAFAGSIVFIATRPFVPSALVWGLMAANLLWVVGCLVLLLGSAVTPTGLGQAFVAIQAVTVGLLVELQWFGLRKAVAQPSW
jgi:hypothetical protein